MVTALQYTITTFKKNAMHANWLLCALQINLFCVASLLHLHDFVFENCVASSTCSFHSASSDPRAPSSQDPPASDGDEADRLISIATVDSPLRPSSSSSDPLPESISQGDGVREFELSCPVSESSQSNKTKSPSLKLSAGEEDGVSMETTSSRDLVNGSKLNHLEGSV